MQYILNENEYQAYLTLQVEVAALRENNNTLSEQVMSLEKRRTADREEILANRERRKELRERLEITQKLLKEARETIALDSKKIMEKSNIILAQEAELASLSSKMKEVMRDCEGSAKALDDARTEAKRLQELADERLNEIRFLKAERCCIVKNSQTGATKVISADKADAYCQSGWMVIEKFLVDRPA